jgi:membrane protease YdiL (CAAX protease family)
VRALPQFPRNRVLASAAANDQNSHDVRLQEQERYGGASGGVNSCNRSVTVQLASVTASVFSSTVMHWDFALILLFLGIAVPLLGRRRVRQLMQMHSTTKMDRLSLYASTLAFQWIAAGVVLWRTSAHEIRTSQLGLATPNLTLTVTVSVVLSALILLNQIMGLRRLIAQPEKIQGILPQLALKLFPQDNVERLAFFALVATVALCEELIYRGFVQRVFQDWSRGSVVLAVIGSAAFFALAHLYQGRRGLVSTLTIGVIFSTIRAWTGSFLPCVMAHFVADITVGMLAPTRSRAGLANQQPHAIENNADTSTLNRQ